MRLSALFAILCTSALGQPLAADTKRDSELILLSPERLDNVGHGNPRPPCPPPNCTFSQSKLCWEGIYSICTNYYKNHFPAGVVRKYFLEVTNITLSPDGIKRPYTLAINGGLPGPTITAFWGETVEITVQNSMKDNGTSIHWHGIRQLNNFINDGVNGVTECPIPPGGRRTYRWVAEQYDDWYHSHHTVQYGDGVFGAINIIGPATAEYDIDLGPITLSDLFSRSAFQIAKMDERNVNYTAVNFLVQGTNANAINPRLGKRYKLVFTPGKKHLLRFINTSTQTYFRVSLDNHNMTVVQTDFVPVVPYVTETIGIAIGQRYSVIIEANQANATYWLRTWPQTTCSGDNLNNGTRTSNAYVQYAPAHDVLPKSTPAKFTDNCDDEFANTNEPYLLVDIDSSGFPSKRTKMDLKNITFDLTPSDKVNRWNIGHKLPAGMDVNWGNPGVLQLLQNMTKTRAANSGNTSYTCAQALAALPPDLDSYCIDGDHATSYWIVQDQSAEAHPLHLHNHDFNIVARGNGNFSFKDAIFNWKNPSRRDVTLLPNNGYVVLAFKADNPSISIFHCHIAWHVAQGLSLQLVEQPSKIPTFTHLSAEWNKTCALWNDWYPKNAYWAPDTDSGLR